MTTEQNAYESGMKEALSAQRNGHANNEAHWFAMYLAEKDKNSKLEEKIKELTPKANVVPIGKDSGDAA